MASCNTPDQMHSLEPFEHMPDTADCWLYAANRELSSEEVAFLDDLFKAFEKDWSSHGRPVSGSCTVVGNRVVVVAAHLDSGDISGCGIDKSLHLLHEAGASRGFEWSSALNIVYEDAVGGLHVTTRQAFKKLAGQGLVTPDTRVIDLSIRSLGDLRNPGLLRPVSSSWHARLLPPVLMPAT